MSSEPCSEQALAQTVMRRAQTPLFYWDSLDQLLQSMSSGATSTPAPACSHACCMLFLDMYLLLLRLSGVPVQLVLTVSPWLLLWCRQLKHAGPGASASTGRHTPRHLTWSSTPSRCSKYDHGAGGSCGVAAIVHEVMIASLLNRLLRAVFILPYGAVTEIGETTFHPLMH